jgi:hypothetical protein
MKYFKLINNIGFCVLLIILITFSSCEDFLEQPTDSITTLDSVFSNPDNAMYALNQAYNDALCWTHGLRETTDTNGATYSGFPPLGAAMSLNSSGGVFYYSDEATQEVLKNSVAQYFVNGDWGPTGSGGQGQREFPIIGVSNAIRVCNIFLENAPKVPLMTTPKWVWDEQFRDQVIAEVRALRAFLHFEMFRRYGGIPILRKVATFEPKPGGGLIITPSGERQSIQSVINFIVTECDAVLPNLKEPSEFSSAEIGRIHKGFVYGLKAKALLYAASPLYNSATPPVSYGDARDSLVCYGNYDKNRWKLAADAYQEAIDWAESRGYYLLDDPAFGKRDSYVLGKISPRSTSPKNNESIYYLLNTQNALNIRTYKAGIPITNAAQSNGTIGGIGFNFVKNNFRKIDGTPLDIPNEGTFIELKQLMRQAEPRFHASVWVPGQKFSHLDQTASFIATGSADTAMFMYHLGDATNTLKGASSIGKTLLAEQPGFFYPKKWFQMYTSSTRYITWSEFSLPEFYLSYAEAMNEYDPTNPMLLYYLNRTRYRGGIPEIDTSDPRFGNQEAMRIEIRKERSVEEFATEHRYFDVRRWKIADDVMGGDWPYIYLYENGNGSYQNPVASWTTAQRIANDAKLSYKMVKLSTHAWSPKMHFYPWFQNEVNKGVLVQNPGW